MPDFLQLLLYILRLSSSIFCICLSLFMPIYANYLPERTFCLLGFVDIVTSPNQSITSTQNLCRLATKYGKQKQGALPDLVQGMSSSAPTDANTASNRTASESGVGCLDQSRAFLSDIATSDCLTEAGRAKLNRATNDKQMRLRRCQPCSILQSSRGTNKCSKSNRRCFNRLDDINSVKIGQPGREESLCSSCFLRPHF